MKISLTLEITLLLLPILGNASPLISMLWATCLTPSDSMLDYVYVPDTQPMDIDGWPTLADMIINNKRVVVMLAYDADQQKVCGCDNTLCQKNP